VNKRSAANDRPSTPTSASLRIVSVDEAEQFAENQEAGVATLRWCSGSSREYHSASIRNELFSFAGIPKVRANLDSTMVPRLFTDNPIALR
jgi:hypothetical protein